MAIDDIDPGRAVAVLGAALVIVGAYLPWYRAGEVIRQGIASDGMLTFLFGCLVLGIGLFRGWDRRAGIVVAGFGGLTLLVSGVATVEIHRAVGNELAVGLVMTLAGSTVMILAGVVTYGNQTVTE